MEYSADRTNSTRSSTISTTKVRVLTSEGFHIRPVFSLTVLLKAMQESRFPIYLTFHIIFHNIQYQMPLEDLQKRLQQRSFVLFSQLHFLSNHLLLLMLKFPVGKHINTSKSLKLTSF